VLHRLARRFTEKRLGWRDGDSERRSQFTHETGCHRLTELPDANADWAPRAMKIALLSYEYPTETGFGGIGTYSYYHARALAALGHTVHVFAGAARPGVRHSDDDGIRVTRSRSGGWIHRASALARTARCSWFHNRLDTAFATYAAVRDALEHETFDVVEAPECGADAALVSTRLKLPLVVRLHSPARLIMGSYPTSRFDRAATGWVEQIAIDRARILSACSRFVADEARTTLGVSAPVHVIPNGIDLDLFDRDEPLDLEARFGVPRGALTVLFANRMEERKGIHLVGDIAVRIMTRYPHVHFVLAGRDLFGYVENRVAPMIRAAGLEPRFHVLGALDLAAVRAVLKHSDVFILPSLWENCPYSCIEAMAARCAIVSSDCGGMPELITPNENGLLATSGSAASFIERLEPLIEDKRLREKLGAAARRTVERRLTNLETARRTVELYRAAVDRAIVPAPGTRPAGSDQTART
jgi:glycogen synthase